jgi:heme a synthase
MSYSKNIFYLYLLSALMAYGVIVIGAYTRLSDAGLGCPDWPGCYGKLFVPAESAHIAAANEAFPERPLEAGKAWKEMIHRYAAAILGLIILALTTVSWITRAKGSPSPVVASTSLLLLVIFQAALGMWTVTLLLKPVIVTAHLLGGMGILALLYWLMLNALRPTSDFQSSRLTFWASLGTLVLFCQIALGGWTSANYSALICTDFPSCQSQWWPQMNFKEGFTLWRGLGVDYEGGVLDAPARTAIHVSHRIGAVLTFLVLCALALKSISTKNRSLQYVGVAILLILILQVSLGIANVLLTLPLGIAVAHNGVAALLLLSLVSLIYFSYSKVEQ